MMQGESPPNSACFSAPGKLILFGEHAVVYGEPAIAAAVDFRTYVLASIEQLPVGPSVLVLRAPNLDPTASPHRFAFADLATECDLILPASAELDVTGHASTLRLLVRAVGAIVRVLCSRLSLPVASSSSLPLELHFTVLSGIPVGSGMGSSAALAVAAAAALTRVFTPLVTPGAPRSAPLHIADLEALAHAAECVFHGAPSGVDAAVCLRGGVVLYTRPAAGVPHLVPLRVPTLPCCIVDSLIPKSTSAMVARVRMRYEAPDTHVETNAIIKKIGDITRRALAILAPNHHDIPTDLSATTHVNTSSCLRTERYIPSSDSFVTAELLQLVRENQRALAELHVSAPELEDIISKCRAMWPGGDVAGKITGAGGGGNILFLCANSDVQNDFSELNINVSLNRTQPKYRAKKVNLGSEGLRQHHLSYNLMEIKTTHELHLDFLSNSEKYTNF